MRYFILFLFCPFLVFAQLRENRPLPIVAKTPSSELADSITGWSLSKDGQWMSKEKTIYPRLISRDEENYENKENRLGIDNFEKLLLYPVKYGQDTLMLLVKLYTSGSYKYPVTKRGWHTQIDAYYYLFRKAELQAAVRKADTALQLSKISLMDGGLLSNVKEKKVLKEILERLRVRERYDRVLMLMTQRIAKTESMRFHIFSLHRVFPDVEGVYKDFKLRGRTVYGNKILFDYMYYETTDKIFRRFFSLPKSFEVETE